MVAWRGVKRRPSRVESKVAAAPFEAGRHQVVSPFRSSGRHASALAMLKMPFASRSAPDPPQSAGKFENPRPI